MALSRLEQFLTSNQVDYNRIIHRTSYSAQRIAASAHVSGHAFAKSVILLAGNSFVMAVIPASSQIDFERLKRGIKVSELRLATEREFKGLFQDCELGAMPPFGNIYNMDVIIAEPLTHKTLITFNAGTHSEMIQMSYTDFHRLVRPKVLNFTTDLRQYQA